MNEKRNQSKSKAYFVSDESREKRRERYYATKSNAKRRKLKLRLAKPKETPERQAQRATKEKASALKWFTKWLDSNKVTTFAMKDRGYCNLTYYLAGALNDCLPED